MESKKPWQSKTLWVNVILALSAFIPGVHEALVAHPEYFTYGLIVINMALRLITKGSIQIGE
jgi:hypothetical protein